MRLRPYKSADADTILSWVRDEETFRRWVTDRYPHYPITPAEMNEKYFVHNGDCPEPDNFYPMTAYDETGLLGHLILRFTDEKKETAAGFWQRAREFFEGHGITVLRVLTDNGSCYRSHAFAQALGPGIKHKFTRPYRPQTNGKVERFNRTLAAEWAYAKPYKSEEARIADYDSWLHHYNHHRPHTGIEGLSPIERVHNVRESYT